MRIMIHFSFSADTGNSAIRSGKVEKVFAQILEDLKPEAAYFFPEGSKELAFSSWRWKIRHKWRT